MVYIQNFEENAECLNMKFFTCSISVFTEGILQMWSPNTSILNNKYAIICFHAT